MDGGGHRGGHPRASVRRSGPLLSLAASLVATAIACGARTGLPTGGGEGASAGSTAGGGGQGGAGGGGVGGVEQLALGADHSCLRTIAGDVYCWGANDEGQLGLGTTEGSLVARRVDLPGAARDIAAGSYHTCAALENDALYCWGSNESGQLGTGQHDLQVASPALVDLGERRALSLGLGEQHSCAAVEDASGARSIYCWGAGGTGQIGEQGMSSVPVLLFENGASVTAGGFHTCLVDTAGIVWCVGTNQVLECGVAIGTELFFPANPVFPDATTTVLGVRSGRGDHTCAIGFESSDGVRCWGANDSGQLGVAPFPDGATPLETETILLPGLADVQAGFIHTCALASGEVYCWGNNDSMQLGSAGPSHPEPEKVAGLADVVAISSGTLHSCAVRSPSEVYCWGSNDFGQLGDGTMNASPAPVRVVLP